MHVQHVRITHKKQKENSHKSITWSERGKQIIQVKQVHCVKDGGAGGRGLGGLEAPQFQAKNKTPPDPPTGWRL